MPKLSHKFSENYTGLVGFGLDRPTDEASLTVYLQHFSDDDLTRVLTSRIEDQDLDDLVDHISRLLKKYLKEEEYHRLFLKDEHEH